MENVHAHTPHRVRTKEKKFTRGLSSCTRNKRSSQVSFFLSLPSFGVFVEFLHPWKPGGALRRGQMPANSRGACVAQETSSAFFFFFWPVFSEFIPHAQTHMHHARTHVHTNAGEAETFHQKGVKTKHSFTVCLWHQHLKGWERRGTTSCTATTTPIFFQPTRTRIPAKGGETKQNRGARMASFLQPLPCCCVPEPATVEGVPTTSYTLPRKAQQRRFRSCILSMKRRPRAQPSCFGHSDKP